MKRPSAASRVPRKKALAVERRPKQRRAKSTTKPRPLGDRGAKVIENGGEPIVVGRHYEDAKITQRDLPFGMSVERARDALTDELLDAVGVSRQELEDGDITDADRRAIFLRIYAVCGNVRASAAVVGRTRRDVETWRMDVADFKRDMDYAYEDCVDELEEEARVRATSGRPWEEVTEKDITVRTEDGEQPIGAVERTTRRGVEASDQLLVFLLRGQRARIYGNKTELSGPEGGPIALKEIVVTIVDPTTSSAEEQKDTAK